MIHPVEASWRAISGLRESCKLLEEVKVRFEGTVVF